MSHNRELSKIFDQIATALELLGENRFKVAANARVSRVLDDMTRDVGDVVDEDPDTALDRLTEIDGIGKSTAEKILEYLDSGEVGEHAELLEKVPAGLFDVLEVPGLGPKAVKAMWEQLGITSVADLKAKIDSPEFAELPRMGAKTIANIKQALAFSERSQDRVPLGQALPLALELRDRLRETEGVRRLDYAGSLRRGRETIGDLDFLVVSDDPEAIREAFTTLPEVTQVLAKGETKCSIRLESGKVAMQADLRIVNGDAYGAALLYFTGSKEHNVRLRERAIQKNLRLNEYGLFEGKEERP
ncbi:MAG: DNA polymerase III, partial [Acidobacteria bacterium]|nr:DNA polymerase III [Acidobacteriota bacterium]